MNELYERVAEITGLSLAEATKLCNDKSEDEIKETIDKFDNAPPLQTIHCSKKTNQLIKKSKEMIGNSDESTFISKLNGDYNLHHARIKMSEAKTMEELAYWHEKANEEDNGQT